MSFSISRSLFGRSFSISKVSLKKNGVDPSGVELLGKLIPAISGPSRQEQPVGESSGGESTCDCRP